MPDNCQKLGDTCDSESANAGRRDVMAACSVASDEELAQAIKFFNNTVNPGDAIDVRQPEIGMVMLRGRIGGDGAPFNIGEATVTRAVVRLTSGEVGYSYLLGRSKARARMAAVLDAIGQMSTEQMSLLTKQFVAPVMQRVENARQVKRAETDATKVNFFTLVRGDD